MNEDKWEVIKFKFERTLQNWEIDKKCNQFTIDSIHSLFPNEIEVIINYIEELQQELTDYKERNEKAIEYAKGFDIERLHEVCEHNLAETLEALLEILDKKDKEKE